MGENVCVDSLSKCISLRYSLRSKGGLAQCSLRTTYGYCLLTYNYGRVGCQIVVGLHFLFNTKIRPRLYYSNDHQLACALGGGTHCKRICGGKHLRRGRNVFYRPAVKVSKALFAERIGLFTISVDQSISQPLRPLCHAARSRLGSEST